MVGAALLHAGAVAGCIAAWIYGLWPISVLLWGLIAWLDHAALTRLHEAAHGTLARPRWVNEALGMVIGTASLTPLAVYRHVHHRHHAHLADPDDPEFWPYNLPRAPRAVRLLYAWLELTIGWIFTPLLYSVRTAADWQQLKPRRRRGLLLEWALMVGFWSALVWLVIAQGWWALFVVGHLVPAWLAGTMQTIRKFTEHLGLGGETILAMTRTVVYRGALGKAASASQLHVEHHGAHHRRARIPWHELPQRTQQVYQMGSEGPLFATHWAAIRDMLPHLLDPKVGPQWPELRRN